MSSTLRRIRTCSVWLCATLLVAGCDGTKSKDAVASQQSPAPVASNAPSATPSPDGATPNATESSPGATPPATSPTDSVKPTKPGEIPPPKMRQVEPAGTEGWVSSNRSASEVAAKIGKALHSNSSVRGEATLYLDSAFGSGQTTTTIQIKNPTTYRVEISEMTKREPITIVAACDGKHRASLEAADSKSAWSKPMPADAPGAALSKAELLQRWPTEFPKLMMSWFLTRQDNWPVYFGALSKGESGFKVTTETRTLAYNGKPVHLIRILATNAKTGAQEQVVADADHYLPVTITSLGPKGAGKQTNLQWSAKWMGGRTFPSGTFNVPKS